MLTILTELMEATTQKECDKIVDKYMDIVSDTQRYELCRWANNAKRRINRIDREKKKSFETLLN
jgi:hypothetical protein